MSVIHKFGLVRLLLLLALPLLMLLLNACAAVSGAPAPITTTLLTDTSITLSAASVKAGDVVFRITNTSMMELHELVVIKTDLSADQLIPDASGRLDESTLTSMGEEGDITMHQSVDLPLKLAPGRYLLICNLPGHYQAGMHTVFTVTP
ncbi:MAG: hypothetical protein HGA45_41850 [Chloroflexales bacterium]|nr:hypothetical protein [Chloroflexales bacterium]